MVSQWHINGTTPLMCHSKDSEMWHFVCVIIMFRYQKECYRDWLEAYLYNNLVLIINDMFMLQYKYCDQLVA